MERTLEKYLEKIRKFRAKGNEGKALLFVEEAQKLGFTGVELSYEAIGISLALDAWTQTLNLLVAHLKNYSLQDLIGSGNREGFLALVREYSGFRSALTEQALLLPTLEAVADWVMISGKDDQNWLIQNWEQAASLSGETHKRASVLTAAGVGYFISDQRQVAWPHWVRALTWEPKLLKKIMAFCQNKNRLDRSKLVDRLKLIRLIAAAGKKTETVTLLRAVGLEREAYALQVLNELPEILPNDLQSVEVLGLRFNLALMIQDQEILCGIIGEMKDLDEDELFNHRKQAMSKIDEPMARHQVLRKFVELYIERQNWESAALLLESLFTEGSQAQVVLLMERVLDRYPIMSQLHFTTGKYYLENGETEKALYHLGAIQQVPEYRLSIRGLLESFLAHRYHLESAEILLSLQKPGSPKAGLIANLIVLREGLNCHKSMVKWRQPRDKPSPLWTLALINGFRALEQWPKAYALLCDFIKNHPDLGPEVVTCAQKISQFHRGDFSDIVAVIETHFGVIKPTEVWKVLRQSFLESSQAFRAQSAAPAQAAPRQPQAPPTSEAWEEAAPELSVYFNEFNGLLGSGNLFEAADVAEKIAEMFPRRADVVLAQLEKMIHERPMEVIWTKTTLKILLRSAAFQKAIEVGQNALSNPAMQTELPDIYQYLALAYEGLELQAEAMRFFCLSSRSGRFYAENRDRLRHGILPKHLHLLKEVLHLVLLNEDQEAWDELLESWFKHRPRDIEHLIKAQISFTNNIGTPRCVLALAYWYLQAGKIPEMNHALDQLDLEDEEIREPLIHLVNLAAIKYPDQSKAKFLLGKYYLIMDEVPEAMDTFRNLVQQIPSVAEAIYQHLRLYLKTHRDHPDTVRLYGLMIRFSLDFGSPVASVRLLDEYGRLDQERADSLADGVLRVVLGKKNNLEALYEFGNLMSRWGVFERILRLHEEGHFGVKMGQERLEWLTEAAKEAALEGRANLAIAELTFQLQDFRRCREALNFLQGDEQQYRALPIYTGLADRFPEDMELWCTAGWAAFPRDPETACRFFEKVWEMGQFNQRVRAFAVLKENGREPDFKALCLGVDDEDSLYMELNRLYREVREKELRCWKGESEPIPSRSMEWLASSGQLDRFERFFAKCESLDPVEKASLEALRFLARGETAQAAWRLSPHAVPADRRQSYFFNAGLFERAILEKEPGSRLPHFLRQAFMDSFRKPKWITANYSQILNLQRGAAKVAD